MRVIQASVALLAAAALISSMATPALAKSKPRPQHDFIDSVSSFFGGGPEGGGHRHSRKTYTDIPGTPATAGNKATNTIVYFGTCNNLAGIQQAGNADADGFCLPFESLIGSEASAGSPGSGPSCAVTTKSKSWSQPSGGERSYGGGGEPTTRIEPGTCDSVKAAEPPKWPPHNNNNGS